MTTLGVIFAVLVVVLAVNEYRGYRSRQRWLAERERLEAYGEHIAAANGRPHVSGIVVVPVADEDERMP